jgi:hypothetical protein
MVCSCNIVGAMAITYPGIISASINGSTNFIYVLQACMEGTVDKVLRGPSTGNINISAYGYLPGGDKYLNVACPSKAGVSVPLFSKFDCENNFTRFFPRRGGQAYRSGDPITGITLVNELCSFNVLEASAQSGPYSPYFLETQYQGTGLIWTGPPIAIDTTSTTIPVYELDIAGWTIQAYLNNFTIEVNPPTGARVNYSFQYDIPDCDLGAGSTISLGELTTFEFMACDSINISYAPTGLASISFTVYSSNELPTRDFNTVTLGGVVFSGYVTALSIIPVPGTVVYEHRYTWTGIGHTA